MGEDADAGRTGLVVVRCELRGPGLHLRVPDLAQALTAPRGLDVDPLCRLEVLSARGLQGRTGWRPRCRLGPRWSLWRWPGRGSRPGRWQPQCRRGKSPRPSRGRTRPSRGLAVGVAVLTRYRLQSVVSYALTLPMLCSVRGGGGAPTHKQCGDGFAAGWRRVRHPHDFGGAVRSAANFLLNQLLVSPEVPGR